MGPSQDVVHPFLHPLNTALESIVESNSAATSTESSSIPIPGTPEEIEQHDGELHPIFRMGDTLIEQQHSSNHLIPPGLKPTTRTRRSTRKVTTSQTNKSRSTFSTSLLSSSSESSSESEYVEDAEKKEKENDSQGWSESGTEEAVEEDEDDDLDVSDIDDILLGRDEAFQQKLLNAGVQSDSLNRWLNKNKRRKKRKRRERKLFSSTKSRRKRRTAAAESAMTPEIEDLIRRANNAYFERNIPQAISFLEETIQKAPGLHDPFHLLGLIYEEELSDKAKALDCYFLGAHLVPEDHHLWKRVAALAQEQGKLKQAIYCYRKCLSVANGINLPLDEPAAFDLATCYIANGEHGKAARRLEELIRAHPGDPFLGRELAKCYHQLNDYDAAAITLESCVSASITQTQWEVLQKDGKEEGYLVRTSTDPAENCITLYDPHATNMLSEVYVESKKFEKCEKLLSSIISKDNIETIPLDLIVKLAASQIYLKKGGDNQIVEYAIKSLLHAETSREEYSDLYILLGEALYQQGQAAQALALFKEVVRLQGVRDDASTWVKIARCQLQAGGGMSVGQASMEKLIRSPDSVRKSDLLGNHTCRSDARLLLSQVLTKLGRGSDTGNIVLSMPAADLSGNRQDEIPPATPKAERMEMLRKLQINLAEILLICSKDPITLTRKDETIRNQWIKDFLRLVEDSELDTQRVVRKNFERRLGKIELDAESQKTLLNELGLLEAAESVEPTGDTEMSGGQGVERLHSRKNRRPTGQQLLSNSIQYLRVKQDLGLVSLEDTLGWKDFGFFLETGRQAETLDRIGVVMKHAGMHRTGVELIEAILSNKRTIRAQQYDLDRRVFQTQLKRLSLQLSIEGGLYRVALSYIREKYLRRPDNSDRALQAFGRLLFCGTFAHATIGGLSSSVEKEALLENRSWCVRQILQRPHSYTLTLLTGHFCSLSCRWPLAVAEYTRAHRLLPRDDLTCLCLATSYLNFATSRSVQDRHAAVLRGFAVMSDYSEQRKRTAALFSKAIKVDASKLHDEDTPMDGDEITEHHQIPNDLSQAVIDVYKAEILYNLARSFHHLNLLHSALPLYLECLQRLPDASVDFKSLYPSVIVPSVITMDARQIRFCASHNLALIYKTRGVLGEACSASLSSVIWGD